LDTLGLIVLVIILIACNIFESHDTYIVYIFSSIVTFAVIRQYTNAKALRIEASFFHFLIFSNTLIIFSTNPSELFFAFIVEYTIASESLGKNSC
jgi:hypothetical protein